MKDFLLEAKYIAKFYRRLGFIECEKGNYQIASACYLYSRNFEEHPSVSQELAYIVSLGGTVPASANSMDLLKIAEVPVIEKKERTL